MRIVTLSLLLLLILPRVIYSQNDAKISTPEVSYYNDTLSIAYNISDCRPGSLFSIDLKIFSSEGIEIRAKNLSGDIGDNIDCGNNKLIIWALAEDNFQINDEIEIEVIANRMIIDEPVTGKPKKTKSGLNRSKIMISSLIIPGLGQKKAKGKSGPLLLGAAGYGALAATGFFALENKKYYGKYLEETDAEQRDQYYNTAEDKFQLLKVSAISAAGIWTANLIWAAIIPYEQSQNIAFSVVPFETGGIGLYARWTF